MHRCSSHQGRLVCNSRQIFSILRRDVISLSISILRPWRKELIIWQFSSLPISSVLVVVVTLAGFSGGIERLDAFFFYKLICCRDVLFLEKSFSHYKLVACDLSFYWWEDSTKNKSLYLISSWDSLRELTVGWFVCSSNTSASLLWCFMYYINNLIYYILLYYLCVTFL